MKNPFRRQELVLTTKKQDYKTFREDKSYNILVSASNIKNPFHEYRVQSLTKNKNQSLRSQKNSHQKNRFQVFSNGTLNSINSSCLNHHQNSFSKTQKTFKKSQYFQNRVPLSSANSNSHSGGHTCYLFQNRCTSSNNSQSPKINIESLASTQYGFSENLARDACSDYENCSMLKKKNKLFTCDQTIIGKSSKTENPEQCSIGVEQYFPTKKSVCKKQNPYASDDQSEQISIKGPLCSFSLLSSSQISHQSNKQF